MGLSKRRPLAVYGRPLMHALQAACAFVDGVPMLYQGDEDPALYEARENPAWLILRIFTVCENG